MQNLTVRNSQQFCYRHVEGDVVIDVEVEYNRGGMDYFQSVNMRRGVYVGVLPLTRQNGLLVATAFSGLTTCLVEMSRFSPNKLNEVAAVFDPFVVEIAHLFATEGKRAALRRIWEIGAGLSRTAPAA